MNIPDEAIEAAAKIRDPWLWNYLDSLGPATEDSMAHRSRVKLLERTKRILEAAAPFIAAQALRGAASEFPDYDLPFMVNGRGVIHPAWWLKDRAAELESDS